MSQQTNHEAMPTNSSENENENLKTTVTISHGDEISLKLSQLEMECLKLNPKFKMKRSHLFSFALLQLPTGCMEKFMLQYMSYNQKIEIAVNQAMEKYNEKQPDESKITDRSEFMCTKMNLIQSELKKYLQ